jgi:hypothetical protein
MQRSVGLSDVVRGLVLLMLVGGMGVGTVQAQCGSQWAPKHTPDYSRESSAFSDSLQRGGATTGRKEGRVLREDGGRGEWSITNPLPNPGGGIGESRASDLCAETCKGNDTCCLWNGSYECKNENACANSPNGEVVPLGGPLWGIVIAIFGSGYGAYRLRKQ